MNRLLLPILALTAVACASNRAPNTPAVAAAPVATAVPAAVVAEEAPKAPVSPIEALVVKAKACPFGEDGFDGECEAFKAWEDEEEAFADGKGDDALLKLIASGDPKDRFLGADRLGSLTGTVLSEEHASDPAVIDRILAAAAKEKNVPAARQFAGLVAHLDLVSTNRLAKAVSIAKAHPLDEYRQEFVSNAGFFSFNRGEPLVSWADELATGSDKLAARRLYTRFTRDASLSDRACKGLAGMRKDADSYVAWSATLELVGAPACRAHHDAILKDIASLDLGKVEGPKVSSYVSSSLDAFCRDKELPAALHNRALAQAKRLTDAKNARPFVRSIALSAVAACDAKVGASYAARLTNDKDLGSTAKAISQRSAKR